MILRTYVPPSPLSHFVNSFWICEGYAPPHKKERVLPDGSMQLIINLREDITRLYNSNNSDECRSLRGSIISGTHSGFVIIDTAEQASVIGVHFKPGGASPFLKLPANELRDTHVSLDDLWGTAGFDLRNRLLEANAPEAKFRILEKTLLAEATGSLVGNPALEVALREFHGIPTLRTISAVIERTGLSKRRFIQLFDERVGITPKAFCRVRRFQGALRLIARGSRVKWADLAADCGYYDQAHFIHDFRNFSGLNPSTYLDYRTEHMNHVRLAE
jgi:AraC-like DNA-binding protein